MRLAKSDIPNGLTLARLALVPALWATALAGREQLVGLGLAIAAATDVLDGQLARWWNASTRLGSRLDAAADSLIGFSAIGWLLLLAPGVVRDHPIYFSAMPLVALGLLWFEWLKFRKVADLHLTSGRIAGIAGYLFLIQLFTFGRVFAPLLYALMLFSWLLAIESFLVVRTHDAADERVSSPIYAYLAASTGRGRGRG